ncbi:MAG: hypothetical protein ACREAZ_03175 [Nitrososphaera sp.]
MMSPYFSPEKNPCAIPREIVAIHEEISLIDAHNTEHMKEFGKVKKFDESCKYCRPYLHRDVKSESKPSESALPQTMQNEKTSTCRSVVMKTGLERTVDLAGKKGQIVVPRSWTGRRVRVTLI